MKRKAALHNLGCKVNAYELEAIQQMLEQQRAQVQQTSADSGRAAQKFESAREQCFADVAALCGAQPEDGAGARTLLKNKSAQLEQTDAPFIRSAP